MANNATHIDLQFAICNLQFSILGVPRKRERKLMKKELGIFVLLIVLCVIVSLINPNFLLAINLQNLARQIGAFSIFSIGLGLVIITGGIELSVGSMMALLGVLMSMMLTEWKLGVIIAVLACAGIAMFLSFIHGLLITRVNMQPFIVTLCGLLFYRGLARFITKDETKGFGTVGGLDFLRFIANGNLLAYPCLLFCWFCSAL